MLTLNARERNMPIIVQTRVAKIQSIFCSKNNYQKSNTSNVNLYKNYSSYYI